MLASQLAFILLTSVASPKPNYDRFRDWGEDSIRVIRRDYWIPDRSLYTESFQKGRPPIQPAFDWGVGVLIPALAAAAKADPVYRAPLISFVNKSRVYWNTEGPVPGYDVLPTPKPKDRYYDDNEWMVMGLAEAAQQLHSSKFFDFAQQTFEYVRSGLDDKLGGGVYWKESQKTSKNACSNGPAAASALALYEQTKEPSYLQFARSVYEWTRSNLRDPADGLYYDSMSLDGRISRTKWTYNSALMLRSAVDLYRFTGEEKYAADAREIQDASLRRWIGPDGAFKDDGKFAFLLLENWFRAYRYVPKTVDPYNAVTKAMEILHRQGADSEGHYGNRWDQIAPAAGYEKPALIDQAAAARAFFVTYLEGLRRSR